MAIAKLSIDIETRLATFERDLNRMSSSAASAGKRIESSFSGVKSLFAGLAGALSVGAVTASLKTIIDDLDKLDETAERVGVSVESLSSLNYAGRLSGVQFDDMTTALTKLSVKMQDAASGGKEAGALFSDLGVKVTDSSGRLKSADVVFAEVAERFSNLEDGAGKTALAVDLFGKSGAALVPLLNNGAIGLERMRKEAEALGAIIDGSLTKQAAEFNDNLDRMSIASGAAGRAIASDLIPVLNDLTLRFVAGAKAGGGILGGIDFIADGLVEPTKKIKDLNRELENTVIARDRNASEGRSTAGYDADISNIQRKIAAYKELRINQVLAEAGKNYGNEGRGVLQGGKEKVTRTPAASGGGGKAGRLKPAAERAASFADYDLELTQKIAAAIEKTDVVKAAELVRELEKLDQLAAADETERLNSLLSQTPTDKLQASRDDMLLLTKALTDGRIAEEQYLEAVTVRLDGMSEKTQVAIGEMDEFTKAAAKNIENTLADFLYDPFSDGLESMGKKFADTIRKMAADALAANIAKTLFGDLGASGGGDGGWVGAAFKAVTLAAGFHQGGVVGAGGQSFTRAVPSAMFAGARRYHGGGLAGDEVPAILQKGERVLTKEQQREGRQPSAQPQNIRIVNAFDNSVIGDYLGSAAGEKVIMNAVQRNAGAFRQVMA